MLKLKKSQTKLNSINLKFFIDKFFINYYSSEIKLNNEKISELHLKKIINKSEYFNKNKINLKYLIISFLMMLIIINIILHHLEIIQIILKLIFIKFYTKKIY